jgi:hypothetical protein
MVYNNQEVEAPWKRAQSGAVWRKWQNVPNDIRPANIISYNYLIILVITGLA